MFSRKATVKQTLPFRSYEIQLEDDTTRRWTSMHLHSIAHPLSHNSHARKRQKRYNLTDESNSSVLIHQHQSQVAQSSFAANNPSDGVDNLSSGVPVVVKTCSGLIVMPPVGTVNITNG